MYDVDQFQKALASIRLKANIIRRANDAAIKVGVFQPMVHLHVAKACLSFDAVIGSISYIVRR
ncbi:hypothetical protein EYZ11_006033 [Aspergillus tanneri]|uniref:Uncharacterized protein n=1 Tax=Aspergillus tanneri TaxID=1220188 RepID=A0A4S3JIW5_9EURO|nr:hypothetical protein EYZ11_006033 [Aspergillus tanneri]